MISPDYHHVAIGASIRPIALVIIYARLNAQASLQVIDTDQIQQGAYQFRIIWTSSEGNNFNQTYQTDDQGYATTLYMDYGSYTVYNMSNTSIGTIQVN